MSNKRILPISIAVTLGLSLIIILTLALMVGPVASQEPDESARAVDNLQAIDLIKTVGTEIGVCASSDEIYVNAGTDVVYCYEVTNSGTLTLTNHFLDDSELGNLLNDFPFDVAPGISYWITESAQIDVTTVNSATWMACEQGPERACASDSDTATVNIVTPASFPTCADFETGSLPSYMFPLTTTNGAANGRVEVTTAFPNTGLYGLDIDTDCDECGGETLQSATMVIDLSGESNVELDFWVHEHGDENNPEDGVFISDDGGGTWAQIVSLNDFPASYENVVLDLAAATTGAGMNLVDGFQISFQSMDNSSIPTDGYSFDDICVQEDLPEIDFEKTVGLDPSACALTDAIDVPAGTEVTYCFLATNTGNFTFTHHTVIDSKLGTSGFDFVLTPTNSIWFTAAATIDVTTVNTATWTAERPPPPGPGIEASDTDTATVTVVAAPLIEVVPDSLSSIQLPDVVVTKTLTISNVGDADLDWLIEEAAPQASCDAPSDIPWLSANPISGTLAALSGQDVDVTFDSTGVVPGLYTGTLCIESNDYYGRLVEVPVTLEVGNILAIDLEKTVGLDPNTCAATSSLSVPAGGGGTDVYYCYTASNIGTITMTLHTLVDSEFGTLLQNFPYPLGPGQSVNNVMAGVIASATITSTTVNTATWTAWDAAGGSTSDSSVATVTVQSPTGVLLTSLGEATPLNLTPIWLAAIVIVMLVGASLAWRRKTIR